MKKNTIVSIEQDVVKDIKANRKKRIKGSLFVNNDGHVDFDAEKKGGSGSDCETIFETNCGRLYMSECSIFIKYQGFCCSESHNHIQGIRTGVIILHPLVIEEYTWFLYQMSSEIASIHIT